jgi:hypothetical protein
VQPIAVHCPKKAGRKQHAPYERGLLASWTLRDDPPPEC